MTYRIVYTKQAKKDGKKIAQSGLKTKAQKLLTILQNNPWQNPPLYEKQSPPRVMAEAVTRTLAALNLLLVSWLKP